LFHKKILHGEASGERTLGGYTTKGYEKANSREEMYIGLF
jgi:hypothetical protein